MEFRILGPLEAIDEERALAIGGAKQRALLGVLLIHANEVVSSDRLIDELWREQPPEHAAKALHVHVSQLRKVLEPAAPPGSRGRVLDTRPPGYVLHVGRDQLDAHRFERLVTEGKAALEVGDPLSASTLLREALALWRGPALADLGFEPFAQAEIARLAELRLAALEERIEADLALARHNDVVGELDGLVTEHPLRERLRVQHMLALYRSGRQAEALQSYHNARHILVDELGIEPGRALHELERAILTQDPALDALPRAEPTMAPSQDAGSVLAEPALATPRSDERKLATVLFADIAQSTELGEQDPERTRALLERYSDAMAEEVRRAGGVLEKFIGDAVMAAFGAPLAQEDHAERALHAALAMQQRFEELFGGSLSLEIGVNSGEVVVGEAREGGSFVTGDAVNVAARLEQAAAPGQILVGERTFAAARGAFVFGDPTTAEVKGKAQGVVCRRLLSAISLMRPRGVTGLRHAFIGRERELELLRTTYDRAVHGQEPHLVTIVGDAGVGKSTLVRELWGWLRRQSPEPRLLTGRCLPYGRGITYWPLGEVLKEHLGLLESDPPDALLHRLGDRQILGLTLGLDVAAGLHPLVARERLHEAWVDLGDELVAAGPAAILVGDLHRAEEPLFELLDRLLRDVSGPLLLLATARPELLDRRPTWGSGRHNATQLWLEPLSAEEAARMLEALLGPGLPARLHRIAVEGAEGNPFFLEELVAVLIDRGFLTAQDGGWRLRDLPPRLEVPDSVQSVLAARIDLLGEPEKAALQSASVVGRVFWAGPVSELLVGREADLRVLVERDFIRRRPESSFAGEREFAFKHALTRDVAYESLPKARRAHLHAAFAAWIERVGEGRDEQAPLLAYHYAEAVRPEDVDLAWGGHEGEVEQLRGKALAWLRRAAELASGRYALTESADLFRRAALFADDPGEQAALLRRAGRASALSFDRESFWETMLRAADLAGDPETRAECYGELAFESVARFMHGEDRPLIEEWSDLALTLGNSRSRARARALVARSFFYEDEAGEVAAEAAAIARQLGDLELLSWALYVRTDAALARNEYAQAQHWTEQRLALLPEIPEPDHVADAYWSMIPAYAGEGLLDQARHLASLQDSVTSELTPHHRVHGIAGLLEVEELAAGWDQISRLASRVEDVVAANSDSSCVHNPRSLLVCALASACLENNAEAARLEALADSLDVDEYGRCFETRAHLAMSRGDLAMVERLVREFEDSRTRLVRVRKLAPRAALLDSLAALGDGAQIERLAPPLLLPGTYLEPFALRALGIVREDAGLIERAIVRYEAMGLGWHASQTRVLL